MLYDIGFLIFSLFYLPTLLFKGRLHRDFLERFGIYSDAKSKALAAAKDAIWIQAVSVGEVALCRSFIPSLKARFPDRTIVLSTITRTGSTLAAKLFSNDATIIYFPLDFSFIVKSVVSSIRPKIYIMVETELWPNLLRELARNSIPSILINGRISDKSFGKYRLAKPFLKNILDKVEVFCMQSEEDAERIRLLGAPSRKVEFTGNMKFDVEVTAGPGSAQNMQELLGMEAGDELLVAGSTHRGEEKILLDAFGELKKEFTGLRLLIAPRHIERVAEIQSLAKRFGYRAAVVSQLTTSDIFILDTIGQLNDAYSMATIVFVGGSLTRYGGHNPIEPAAFEKPVLFGPHMFNFKSIASVFLSNDAALQVQGTKDLVRKIRSLLKDAEECRALGRNARFVVMKNRGATEHNLRVITQILKKTCLPAGRDYTD